MITLASVCKIAKTLTAKADHDESGAPTTTARLKFSELQIDRDTIDELLGETCAATWEITGDDQGDMFSPTSKAAASATTETQRIIDGLGRGATP